MPKRKQSPCRTSAPSKNITLASLDAALDMLATDTFARLDSLINKFELAAGVQVAPGQAKARWDEAVKRYYVMRSMEVLSCSGSLDKGKGKAKEERGDGVAGAGGDENMDEDAKDENGRSVIKPHLGPVHLYGLCPDEEQQWRRWSPKTDDVVLVDLPEHGVWPGKVIDKKTFYQGRSIPKGNHYFPVRIYSETIDPCVMVKSRLLPFNLRSSPPLLASSGLQSAYHHANSPSSFDALAHARELNAAHCRSHPGVGGDPVEIKRVKEKWNEQVNWVMNERRAEKMRHLAEDREKKLASISVSALDLCNGNGNDNDDWEDIGMSNGDPPGGGGGKKKRRNPSIPLPDIKKERSESPLPNNTIFGPMSIIPSPFPSTSLSSTPRRNGSPALSGLIRPGLGVIPTRPLSPRRLEKRRSVFNGVGEYSPGKGRGSTWTPPRILPSGDETAPGSRVTGIGKDNSDGMMEEPSPVPSGKFDFVSPLGPVHAGRLNGGSGLAMTPMGDRGLQRSGSLTGLNGGLDVVKEEMEGEGEEGWTLVSGKKTRRVRGGSAPCQETKIGEVTQGSGNVPVAAGDGMDEDEEL